ncbi:virion core protein, T7 gp14 family [Roseicella aerolata]|uniref:Uncharacterized protein n=1 Tax=Roseicella aerolata TaxID=2883479 RepID=A0A9X1IHJ3_9PROT|nr:hypothetical protein [Roseicella aerolata]MCB4824281.1 hypothetical protein [Roseicella aerolata]
MCIPLAAGIALAGVAVSAAGTAMSYSAAKSASKAQNSYNAETEKQQLQYRQEVMEYQNQVWEQDLAYSEDLLSWAQGEWNRQERYDVRARQAIEKNTLAGIGQVLLRQVEEDMSVVAQGMEVGRQGQQARASASARDRGVEGNSVDAILQDVSRQEGEVLNVMAMNRAGTIRQLNREAVALDAQGDQQLANIQLKTYAPQAQIRQPSPVSPVNPAAPVASPNVGTLVTGLAGAGIQGITNYSTYSGQKVPDTVNDLGKWMGRQFSITPAPAG